MSVIERAEKRMNDELRQHDLGLDNADDIRYWAAYLDGARAQRNELPKQGEIVRCGECKWKRSGPLKGIVYCRIFHLMRVADWFCADGERKVQDANK